MASRSSTQLLVHEFGHGLASLILSKESFAIAREGKGYYAVWIAGGFLTDRERAAFVAAGPMTDLLRLGIISEELAPNQLEFHLRTFLANDDDGTTDGDAARFRRFYYPLSLEDKEAVILMAMKAASKAVSLYHQVPQLFEQLAPIIDGLKDNIVIEVTTEDIETISRGGKATLKKNWLSNYLNSGDREIEETEAKDEAARILAEMREAGEIDARGYLTAAGLARLELNENR